MDSLTMTSILMVLNVPAVESGCGSELSNCLLSKWSVTEEKMNAITNTTEGITPQICCMVRNAVCALKQQNCMNDRNENLKKIQQKCKDIVSDHKCNQIKTHPMDRRCSDDKKYIDCLHPTQDEEKTTSKVPFTTDIPTLGANSSLNYGPIIVFELMVRIIVIKTLF